MPEENNNELKKILGALLILVLVGVALYGFLHWGKAPSIYDGAIVEKPSGFLELTGVIDQWKLSNGKIVASIETNRGKFTQTIFSVDQNTKYRAGKFYDTGKPSRERIFKEGSLSEISKDMFVEIYLRKPAKEDPSYIAETIRYWE